MNHIIRALCAIVLLAGLVCSVPAAFGDTRGGTGSTTSTTSGSTTTTTQTSSTK
jgi:hypothetical protein